MSDCDFNPEAGRPALIGEPAHAEAVLLVRRPNDDWHLCADCAALPCFKAFKKRPLKAVSP